MADLCFSVTANANNLVTNINSNDLPLKATNLQCHNLYKNSEAVTEVFETLSLNLTFGVSLPAKKNALPINFDQLQRSIRLGFTKFGKKKDKIDITKSRFKSAWEPDPDPALKIVEDALNRFKMSVTKAFERCWSRSHITNLEECKTNPFDR